MWQWLLHPQLVVVRYGSALLSVGLVLLLVLLFDFLREHALSVLLLAAVLFTLWYGQLGPGIFAIVLSAGMVGFFFLVPTFSLEGDSAQALALIVFILLALAIHSLQRRRQRLERLIQITEDEFRLARQIQEKLFPTEAPQVAGFDLAGACHPALATGGDYFDFIPMADGSIGIALGDVSSHGFGPALLMAETHACLRALARLNTDVGEILTHTNYLVCEDTAADRFITVFLARLRPAERSLVYASAGHQAFLLEPNGHARQLESTGLPLGIDKKEIIFCSSPILLEQGHLLLLLTDGVLEARCPLGVLFGLARALEVVLEHREQSARQIIETLFQEVRTFTQNQPQLDDMAAIVLKGNGAGTNLES